jgi:hypothetical protein
LVGGVLVVLGLAYSVLHGMAERAAHGESISGMLAYIRNVLMFAAALVAITALSLAHLLWRLGQATRKQERFPPEGLPKLIEAAPRKGVAAIYLGRKLSRAAQFIAAAGILLALGALWYSTRL